MSSLCDVDDEKFCRFCSNFAGRLLKASKPTGAENINQDHSKLCNTLPLLYLVLPPREHYTFSKNKHATSGSAFKIKAPKLLG